MPSQAASACPGRLLEKTAGGSLTEELIAHGAGPETEIVRLCSASGGRRYTFPEGPQGYGYSFLFTGLTFAGDQTAALAWTWFREAPELWVVDLATDRVLFKKVVPSNPAHPETIEVGKIVLQRDGSVAWTELSPSGACEVVEHTSHGTHVLNPTRKAQPTSLTLVGTTPPVARTRWSGAHRDAPLIGRRASVSAVGGCASRSSQPVRLTREPCDSLVVEGRRHVAMLSPAPGESASATGRRSGSTAVGLCWPSVRVRRWGCAAARPPCCRPR